VNTVETALVILLAVGFLVLLILAIILTSIMIAVMKNVRRISDRAEAVTSNAAEITEMIGAKIAPFALSTALGAIFKRAGRKKK
jgi:endonuclease III